MEISKLNIHSEQQLVDDLRHLIDETRRKVAAVANAGIATMYWQIGERINREVLGNQRQLMAKELCRQCLHIYNESIAHRL